MELLKLLYYQITKCLAQKINKIIIWNSRLLALLEHTLSGCILPEYNVAGYQQGLVRQVVFGGVAVGNPLLSSSGHGEPIPARMPGSITGNLPNSLVSLTALQPSRCRTCIKDRVEFYEYF